MLRVPLTWTLSLGHLPCPCMGRMQDRGQDADCLQVMERVGSPQHDSSHPKQWDGPRIPKDLGKA